MKLNVLLMLTFMTTVATTAVTAQDNLTGKWNLTVDVNGKPQPSWLEVKKSGLKTLVGHFVGMEGSARPISIIHFENGIMRFSIPPQWEKESGDLQVVGRLQGDELKGTMVLPNGKKHDWTAKRAPSLNRTSQPVWGEPVILFDGNNLDAWTQAPNSQWKVENGSLISPKSGVNLISKEKFDDFKLHIEFRYPKGSNSGVYLRGRYEVQIIDSKGQAPSDILFGGVYGFVTPSEMAAGEPGEWQTMDITLVGRLVTVVANGKQVVCEQPIPGTTGGALDSNEGEPGPILLQGDHGPIEFRKIIVTPAIR